MNETTKVEAELIHRVTAGDKAALGELYDQLAPVLLVIALRVLHDTREAEDVLHDVFLQIWGKSSSFREEYGSPVSWLIKITRNKSIEQLRSAQKRAEIAKKIGSLAAAHLARADDEQIIIGKDTSATMRAVTDVLSPEQRTVIEMAYYQGMTYQQSSENLGEPLGTVKSRIRRGLIRLREHLGDPA